MRISFRRKSKDLRQAVRTLRPAITALYWTGGVCRPLRLRDVSASGAYIKTNIDWCVGSVVHLVLLGAGSGKARDRSTRPTFALWARIVHTDSRGMGVQFLMRDSKEEKQVRRFLETIPATSGNGRGESGPKGLE